jgi:branched-chain amino acid transport system permease protein
MNPIFIYVMLALGLNIVVGFAGLLDLGYAAFFAIGGYSSAILGTRYGVHGLIALVIGAALAGTLAFLVARPILRLSGHYLAMATLGLGIIVSIVINREIEFTGGPDGISVPALQILGWKLRGPETWYWIVAGVLLLVIWLSLNLMRSAFGRGLRALADSEIAAQTAGLDTAALKARIFVLSAVIAAVSGSLFANAERFITPDEAGFLRSVELVTMVVVGGMASTFGAALGAALLTLLPQALSGFELWHDFLFGVILVTAMIFLPKGIVPSLHLRLLERRQASRPDLSSLR